MTLLKAWPRVFVTLLAAVLFFYIEFNNAESQNPPMMTNCNEKNDPFIYSEWFNDKVFLHPWMKDEKKGDWYHNRAYCAKHCAEMVTIKSSAENLFFHDFMRSVGMQHPGAWLGAQIRDMRDVSRWYNGVEMNYCPKAPGEFNEPGLTCLDVGWDGGQVWWRNFYCTGAVAELHMIACQRHKT